MSIEDRFKNMEEMLENIERYKYLLSEFYIEEMNTYNKIRQAFYNLKNEYYKEKEVD